MENPGLHIVKDRNRSTRHIKFKFDEAQDGKPLYQDGDYLEINRVNGMNTVEQMVASLALAVVDTVVEVKNVRLDILSPRSMAANTKDSCTMRNALLHYADLASPQTRYNLSAFREAAKAL
ncbi:hypothetical protein Unana1_02481 [Umbelopsis nana]